MNNSPYTRRVAIEFNEMLSDINKKTSRVFEVFLFMSKGEGITYQTSSIFNILYCVPLVVNSNGVFNK